MREERSVQYILRFNRYYIFWEDHSNEFKSKSEADQELARMKLVKPYWKWKIVERETIIRETDFE